MAGNLIVGVNAKDGNPFANINSRAEFRAKMAEVRETTFLGGASGDTSLLAKVTKLHTEDEKVQDQLKGNFEYKIMGDDDRQVTHISRTFCCVC